MLAVEIEFLTGRYVATAHNERSEAEWPPHPARFFSALVAEWGNAETPSDQERAVLARLETFGAPSIAASDASTRSPVTHFVPINDPTVIGEALWKRVEMADEAHAVLADPNATAKAQVSAARALTRARDVDDLVGAAARPGSASPMPQHRVRQARLYPSVTPDVPTVAFVWPESTLDDGELAIFDVLLERVTRLGHSSSLVSCRLGSSVRESTVTYSPSPQGGTPLRTVGVGQLSALEHEYRTHRASRPRSLPATVTTYAKPSEIMPSKPDPARPDCSGDWFVLEITPRLAPQHIVAVTSALRGALLKHATEQPEVLHGHQSDGQRTLMPHVAFLALPDVGHPHASGNVMGVAVLLPRDLGQDAPERKATLGAIGRWLQRSGPDVPTTGALYLPGGRQIHCELQQDPSLASLRMNTWANPSAEWVSASPLALPWRAKKNLDRADEWQLAEEWVVESCRHVGLPDPIEVDVGIAPMLMGTLPANRYPTFRQGGTARRLVHARVRFASRVAGPFVLGSGRYFGLMRPVAGVGS
jgi:CRISPR-associated protein Csb2